MFPIFTTNNLCNSPRANTVSECKRFLCYTALTVRFADAFYLAFVKFSRCVLFAASYFFGICETPMTFTSRRRFGLRLSGVPSFFRSIELIVRICPCKQVSGIYARGIIAMMANVIAFWNFTKMYLVGNAVCADGAISSDAQNTVSTFNSFTCPKPTGWGFLNLVPKTIFGWYTFSTHDMNLLNRFVLWLGLTKDCRPFSSRFYFTTDVYGEQ